MTDEVEAFGQITTAGLAASAVSGRGGPRQRGAAHLPAAEPRHAGDLAHGACANCASVLTGPFCAACGQSAHVHRSVAHIFEEFLHGIWHFDSKAWRTLPRLVFAPGRLTRDYVYGRRAGYIAPLALFLFSVFLMFFVFGLLGGPDVNQALTAANSNTALAEANANVDEARGEVAGAVGEITGAKADPDTTPARMATVQTALAERQSALAAAEKKAAAVAARPAVAAPADKAIGRWQDQLADGVRSGKLTISSGSPAINARVRAALLNPDFALYRIEQKAYKLSFLLIPMSLPVLWLLFAFRRDVHTYDHVVFALYSLSFMSLLFITIALAAKIDPTAGVHGQTFNLAGSIGGMLFFAAPVHMFAQLRGAYRLRVSGALWRTFVLGIASLIILAIFAGLIVVVGLAD